MNQQDKNRPIFPGISTPRTDFEAVMGQLRARPLYYDVALDNARTFAAGTQLQVDLQGNFCYIDQLLTAGNAQLIFEDQQGALGLPLQVYPGSIFKVPFTRVTIINTAQAGKVLRIVYGVDVDFVPAAAAGVSVINTPSVAGTLGTLAQRLAGGVNGLVVTALGDEYATAFGSTTALVAVTPENVLAAASNTNGVRVIDAQMRQYCATAGATGQRSSFLAKATAPGSVIDGNVLLLSGGVFDSASGVLEQPARLARPRLVGSGKRLDFISVNATAGDLRSALYTAL